MEVIETVESNGVGTVLILAAAMTVGAVAWNKMLKPIGRKIKEKQSFKGKGKERNPSPKGTNNVKSKKIPTEK